MQVRKYATEGIHPGFETQSIYCQKSKTGVSVHWRIQGGRGRQEQATGGSKFFHLHAFFGKKFKNNPILGVGVPSLRKILDPPLQWSHEKD